MRPDVALIAPYPPAGERHGGHSGVASYAANLATALAADGLAVTVLAPELEGDPTQFDDGQVKVRRAYRLGPRALPAAVAAAQETGAGLIHLQWELFLYGGPSALAGLLPALARARLGSTATPLVTTLHQVLEPAAVDRSYTALHRVKAPAPLARAGILGVQAALTRASAATIVHEESFRAVLPGAAVIPHGVEWRPSADRRPAADRRPTADERAAMSRRALGPGLVAMCFGFLAPYKGLELAIDAAGLAGSSVQLVIAGGEHPRLHDRHGGYAAELQRRSRHVRFTGYVPDRDVSAWFTAADVVLLPYPRPFAASGVLALALAHDAAVLMSPALARSAGAPSVLTAPAEPRGLGAALGRLSRDPAAVDELRRWTGVLAAGRRWDAVARLTVDVYEEVLHVDHRAGRSVRAA